MVITLLLNAMRRGGDGDGLVGDTVMNVVGSV